MEGILLKIKTGSSIVGMVTIMVQGRRMEGHFHDIGVHVAYITLFIDIVVKNYICIDREGKFCIEIHEMV